MTASPNLDEKTIAGFGAEWAAYDQIEMDDAEYRRLFNAYFSLLDLDRLNEATGADIGCGSGRWAAGVAPRVGKLHCVDPAKEALAVARRRLSGQANVQFHQATTQSMPFEAGSLDFAYSLGVLHHIPDTAAAMADCVRILKPGAPFLVYLYYRFDNRPAWFRLLWQTSDGARRIISRLPFTVRKAVTSAIAAMVYWPLARSSSVAEKAGLTVTHWPLSAYRRLSFYTMRTDALDRFGTRLEQRFTRDEIRHMMEAAGCRDVRIRDDEPYWVACGIKA